MTKKDGAYAIKTEVGWTVETVIDGVASTEDFFEDMAEDWAREVAAYWDGVLRSKNPLTPPPPLNP